MHYVSCLLVDCPNMLEWLDLMGFRWISMKMPLVNKAMNMDNGQVDTNGEGEKGK